MHKLWQGIRTTQGHKPSNNTCTNKKQQMSQQTMPKKQHRISLTTVDTSTLKQTIATDSPGQYPVTSARGHNYIFVMYDYDSNYIHAVPIKSRRSCDLVSAFQTCYVLLTDNGLMGKIVRLDNEISATMIKHIQSEQLEYQLAYPGDHRVNYAEGAIQTYKNHFISTLHGTDPEFPANCWDLLMPQINITLNLLQMSRYHPKLSAYHQIHGAFD